MQELSTHDKRRLLYCLNCEAVLAFLLRRKGVEQTDDNEYRGERVNNMRRVCFGPTCASVVTIATLMDAWEVGSAN